MSRCEHGQPIRLFCVSDTCNWRDAGGCENCHKKYHSHFQNIDTISIDKLEQIAKMFSVDQQVKNKSKALQQAVYNYFIIMKNQMNNSIDAVSKIITSKLNYPYLYSEGHLGLYRKMKNKQYKKITKKQIKKFRNFADTQNKELIEFNERKLYLQQVSKLSISIKNINQSFLSYTKAVEKIDNSFAIQRSFYQKISDICESVIVQSSKNKQQKKETEQTIANEKSVDNQKNADSNKNVNLAVNSARQQRNRKVSIDNAMGLNVNRFNQSVAKNIDDNEKQISEKKKKLFQMLNNPTQVSSAQNTSEKNNQQKTEERSRKTGNQFNFEARSLEKDFRKQASASKNVQKVKSINTSSPADKNAQDVNISQKKQGQEGQNLNDKAEDSEKNNIFLDLMSKGINLPEMIMHTILPRQASKQKLYQDTKDVKERKITIPVKNFEQKQQNQSPLLKIKKQKKKEAESQNIENTEAKLMNKIKFFDNESKKSIIEATEEAQNQSSPVKQKQNQKLHLKDRQADSLALLLQSLRLPAEKAIPVLETAIKLAYNNLSAAQYLSYLYLITQKPRECLQLCNKILQQLEDSPQGMQLSIHISNNKAAALNMLGRYSESIGILEKCLAYYIKDIYYKNLGDAYFSIAIYQKACINYQNAIKMNPHLEQAYYNLAVCYFLQDHMNEAKFNVTNALKINPRNEEYLKLNRQISKKLQV